MSCSLNSLKGGYIGDSKGTTTGAIRGDTRSLDNGLYRGCIGDILLYDGHVKLIL